MKTLKANVSSLDMKMSKYRHLAKSNGSDNIAADYSEVEDTIRKLDEEFRKHSEVSNIYYSYHDSLKSEHSDTLTELCSFEKLVDYIDKHVDNPFFIEHEHVMSNLSKIKSENYKVQDTYGVTNAGKAGSESVSFVDVFEIDGIDKQLRSQYDALKASYEEKGEVYGESYEDFVAAFSQSGEFDFVFQEQKDREANWGWLSFIIDCVPIVGSVKNGIEIFVGHDLITGREISNVEKAIMAAGIILDCIPGVGTVGSIAVDVVKQAAKIGLRGAVTGVAKNLPKYLAKEFVINIAGGFGGIAGGHAAEKIGLPPWMGGLLGALAAGGLAGRRLYGGKTVKTMLDDGSMQIKRPNGTIELRKPNGDTVVIKPNGDMRIRFGEVDTNIPHGQTGIFDGIDDIPTKQFIANELFDNYNRGRISLTDDPDPKVLKEVKELRESAGLNRIKDGETIPQGNFGYATIDIDIQGIKSEYYAHSRVQGTESKNGNVKKFSPKPDPSLFDNFDAPNTRGDSFPRTVDTEIKILNDIASQLGDNTGARGTIELFTERKPCESCKAVIWQFTQRYPNIKINVSYSNK